VTLELRLDSDFRLQNDEQHSIVRMWSYTNSVIHARTIVSDDQWRMSARASHSSV
jgi:hypothetical protein